MIYWHPKHGAHFIKGNMLDQWGTAGYEKALSDTPQRIRRTTVKHYNLKGSSTVACMVE